MYVRTFGSAGGFFLITIGICCYVMCCERAVGKDVDVRRGQKFSSEKAAFCFLFHLLWVSLKLLLPELSDIEKVYFKMAKFKMAANLSTIRSGLQD